MRKIFTLISFIALFGVTTAFGQTTETIDFGDKGFTAPSQDLTGLPITQGDVTVTFANDGGSTKPQWYDNGSAVRFYGKNTLIIEASGKTITRVVFNGASGGMNVTDGVDPIVDNGTLDVSAYPTTMTWTGSSDEVVLTRTATTGNIRITSIAVTTTGTATQINPPTITGTDNVTTFALTLDVTIAGSNGSTVYYTTDGTDPKTSATAQSGASPVVVPISATTTIQAYATNGTLTSPVVSQEFTQVAYTDMTVADVAALTGAQQFINVTFNNAQVVNIDGDNVWIREGDKAISFYGPNTFATNDVINGTLYVDNKIYNDSPEIVPNTDTDMSTLTITPATSTTLAPTGVTTGADVINHVSDLVLISPVTISGKNATAADGTVIALYNPNGSNTTDFIALADGTTQYDLIGIVVKYKGGPEILPYQIDPAGTTGIDGVAVDEATGDDAPVFNLAGQRVNPNTKGIVIKNGKKVIVK